MLLFDVEVLLFRFRFVLRFVVMVSMVGCWVVVRAGSVLGVRSGGRTLISFLLVVHIRIRVRRRKCMGCWHCPLSVFRTSVLVRRIDDGTSKSIVDWALANLTDDTMIGYLSDRGVSGSVDDDSLLTGCVGGTGLVDRDDLGTGCVDWIGTTPLHRVAVSTTQFAELGLRW